MSCHENQTTIQFHYSITWLKNVHKHWQFQTFGIGTLFTLTPFEIIKIKIFENITYLLTYLLNIEGKSNIYFTFQIQKAKNGQYFCTLFDLSATLFYSVVELSYVALVPSSSYQCTLKQWVISTATFTNYLFSTTNKHTSK